MVRKQLEHMLNNKLMDELQSANRTKHSFEGAKVMYFQLLINKPMSIMIILDLSAAFDRIDHEFYISHLRNIYSVHVQALALIGFYLSDRLQRVYIKQTLSEMQFWCSTWICSQVDSVLFLR